MNAIAPAADYMGSRYAAKRPRAARVKAVAAAEPNPRAVPGSNIPLTPFEESAAEIESLYGEAKNWLDGTPIETEAQSVEVAKLLDLTRKASTLADGRRKEEAKPFDEGKAEVQARYNPLIQPKKGKCELIEAGCKRALAQWLIVVDREKRAIAAAAQAEADEKARLARDLFATSDVTNLAARELADSLAEDAIEAQRYATKAASDKASVAGGARAVTLRTKHVAALVSIEDAANHYFERRPVEFSAFLLSLAQADATAGVRTIPGFTITEERTAQ